MSIQTIQKPSILRQIISALVLGVGVIAVLLSLFALLVFGLYHNRILPGVTMNGVSLSGMTTEEAVGVISTSYSFPQSGHIILTDGVNKWPVSPTQLGVSLDATATAQNAFLIGRTASLVSRVTVALASVLFGYSASPTFSFDQETALLYLTNLAGQINQPMMDAGLKIENAEVVITQSQPGRSLDIAASLKGISNQIQKMQDGIVNLVVIEKQPKILDVSQQGEKVKEILSQPLILSLPAGQTTSAGPWTIEPMDLAKMLMFAEVNDGQTTQVQIAINPPVMTGYLNTLVSSVDLQAQNARFTFDVDTQQFTIYKHAVVGKSLDIGNSVTAINDALLQGKHSAELSLTLTQPAVSDSATPSDLGITQLISQQTTYFFGSHPERIQNIQTAAERFNGVLIAPGQTVSMSDILGDISLDNGYAEAPIILDGQTIQGVGGGVCQVSTTLFRTALYAGFPIVERHAHSYRVGYYEQTSSGAHDPRFAGMDATVFVPLVDFKFKNDTQFWLLMETDVNVSRHSLTWSFYSTSDGRDVNISTPVITDVVDPPDPVYRENPDLPSGVKKQVEYAVAGANVSFSRTVTRNGELIIDEKYVTHYEPWGDVWEYGPGTEGIPTPTPTP